MLVIREMAVPFGTFPDIGIIILSLLETALIRIAPVSLSLLSDGKRDCYFTTRIFDFGIPLDQLIFMQYVTKLSSRIDNKWTAFYCN